MSTARNRPRSGLGKDDMADEVQLWNNIVDKIKRCRDLSQKFESTSKDVESLKQTIQDGERKSFWLLDNFTLDFCLDGR